MERPFICPSCGEVCKQVLHISRSDYGVTVPLNGGLWVYMREDSTADKNAITKCPACGLKIHIKKGKLETCAID